MANKLNEEIVFKLPCPICKKRTKQSQIEVYDAKIEPAYTNDGYTKKIVEVSTACHTCNGNLIHTFTPDIYNFLLAKIGKIEN